MEEGTHNKTVITDKGWDRPKNVKVKQVQQFLTKSGGDRSHNEFQLRLNRRSAYIYKERIVIHVLMYALHKHIKEYMIVKQVEAYLK